MCESNASGTSANASNADHDRSAGCSHAQDTARSSGADEVGWKKAASDLDFPRIPMPTHRVYDVAGEATLRALARRHHERLRDTAVGHLFPMDRQRFVAGIERAADFLVEKCGGPARYDPPNGERCMRTQHFQFTIDEAGREIWLAQLLQAFDDVHFPSEIREEVWNWVEAMSIRMINRRTMRAQPRRYAFSEARVALGPAMVPRRRPVLCAR